jgi:hypothetical protein
MGATSDDPAEHRAQEVARRRELPDFVTLMIGTGIHGQARGHAHLDPADVRRPRRSPDTLKLIRAARRVGSGRGNDALVEERPSDHTDAGAHFVSDLLRVSPLDFGSGEDVTQPGGCS